MTGVRSYVQELINHAIVSELEFPISWKVFELQFPLLEEKYLENAALLEKSLDWRYEVDGNKIIWLLTQKETTLIANAIVQINSYLSKILLGYPVTMLEMGNDPVLHKAGIALEKSYGKTAGEGDNTVGKWTPVDANFQMNILLGTHQNYDYTTPPPLSQNRTLEVFTRGDFYKFGGTVMVPTQDLVFKAGSYYYEKRGDSYELLIAGTDYQVGGIIADFGFPVYEESVLKAFLNHGYIDFLVDNPYDPVHDQEVISEEGEPIRKRAVVPVKFGQDLSSNDQEPTQLRLVYSDDPVPVAYKVNGVTVPNAYYQYLNAHVSNIQDLNNQGVALFHYDRNYDWEKDLADSTITSNLHIRKLIKGWFGHGKSGWSRDINSLPYVQTLDEHEWANAYKKNAQRYINLVRAVRVEDLLGLVNGNPSKFLLLFTIANLYAVRHELLSIYFRALNEIRKKGLYRI